MTDSTHYATETETPNFFVKNAEQLCKVTGW